MHCKRCEYPLWDLTARVCPECGLGFSPLEYEFVINSVRFMCPHCRQAYYGTGERGHLVPRHFNCVKCGQEIDEAEMVLLPTAGVTDAQTVGGVVPWREREKRGRLWGFFATVGMSAFAPHRLAKYCGERVNWPEAAKFGLTAVSLYVVVGLSVCGVGFAFMQSSRLGIQGNGTSYAMIAWDGAKFLLYPFLGAAIGTAAWVLMAQGILKYRNPKRPLMAKTAECFGYAWGSAFFLAVPLMGVYLLLPLWVAWVTVSLIIQLRVRHGVSAGRAVWAGLSLPLLVVSIVVALIGFAMLAHI